VDFSVDKFPMAYLPAHEQQCKPYRNHTSPGHVCQASICSTKRSKEVPVFQNFATLAVAVPYLSRLPKKSWRRGGSRHGKADSRSSAVHAEISSLQKLVFVDGKKLMSKIATETILP
jgi:hypothetical protein